MNAIDPAGGRPQHGHIGQPVSRVDGPLKVAGRATFAAEIPLDKLLYAALAYSTVARGRITSIDTAAAEAAPGIHAVITYRNAPRLNPPPAFMSQPKAGTQDTHPILQNAEIYWNGQPVAIVLADTQEQADHAKSLIRLTYETLPAITDIAIARARGTETGSFQGEALHNEIGDADAAFAAAPVTMDATYNTPGHNHNAIELHAVTVAWHGDTLHIHDASQLVGHTSWSVAQIFGIDESQVVVTSPFVGGGFGGKCLWQHQTLAAAAAKFIGRPVRLVLSREGVYRVIGGRAPTEQRVALGADQTGKLKALIQTGLTPKTSANAMVEPFILPARSAYQTETMKLDIQKVELDMLSNTFMRAPGESVGTFALESAMDELAHKLDIDPVELRILNEPEKDPVTGQPFSARHIVRAWRSGAQRFGWDKRNKTPGTRREGDWWIGLGCATATYPYYRMPGGAARITLSKDGNARIDIAAHEMGMGTATAHSQVAAELLGLPIEAVSYRYADSTLPGVVLAGGSQQTASVSAAIIAARRALIVELLRLAGNASPLAGLDPDTVTLAGTALQAQSDPVRHETITSILARAGREEISAVADAPPPREMGEYSMHSHGAMFCEAAVNAITGEPRIRRFLGSFDCGRIINPKTAASQFRGGIIMGIGLALMEETQFDPRKGRIMNPSLAEYHVPVQMDVPEIDIIWTDIPDPQTPIGARGIGEIGITGTGAAIANAIFNATGKRVRDLPITLDKLL